MPYYEVSLYRGFFFHIFYCYWARENRSSWRGLRYVEVRCTCCIEVTQVEPTGSEMKVNESGIKEQVETLYKGCTLYLKGDISQLGIFG